jgi:hypothetical protein
MTTPTVKHDTITSDDGSASSALTKDVYLFIQGYITPVLMLIGIMGNTLSLVIFIRARKRADASVQYLSTLAISDTGFIIFLGVADWLIYGLAYVTNGAHSFNFFTYSQASCKVMGFSRHMWEIASAWAIVAFTLERVYIVLFPLKRKDITTKKRVLVIIAIWTMSVGLSAHRIVLNHIYMSVSTASCFYNTSPIATFNIVLFDLAVYNYIPSCLIFLANIAILVGIRRAKRSFKSKEVVSRKGQDNRLIMSLMLVSTLYIVFMTPASASVIYHLNYLLTSDVVDEKYNELLYTIVTFLDQFSLLNYCFNFIIYGCTLPFYRNEARRLFTLCKMGQPNNWRVIQSGPRNT